MSINRGMRRNNGEFIRRIIITTAIGVLVILATLIYTLVSIVALPVETNAKTIA